MKIQTTAYNSVTASGIWFLAGAGVVRFAIMARLVLESSQPPIQQVLRVLSPTVNYLKHKANHSPPSNAEVKNV